MTLRPAAIRAVVLVEEAQCPEGEGQHRRPREGAVQAVHVALDGQPAVATGLALRNLAQK